MPECQKLKIVSPTSMALNPSSSDLEQFAVKGLNFRMSIFVTHLLLVLLTVKRQPRLSVHLADIAGLVVLALHDHCSVIKDTCTYIVFYGTEMLKHRICSKEHEAIRCPAQA